MVWSITMLAMTTALGLVYPKVLSLVINKVILSHEYGLVIPYLIIIIAAALVKSLVNFGQQYTGQLFGLKAVYDLRNELYRKLNRQSYTYYDNVHTGDLMSRMTADLDAFRQFLAFGFNGMVNFVLLLAFGLGLMFSLNVWLTLAMLVLLPVLGFIAVKFDGLLWPAYKGVRKSLGRLNTKVQENIMGVRTVKSFAREPYEVDKFTENNTEYYSHNLKTMSLWKTFFPYMELVGNLEAAIAVIFGGWLVFTHHMSPGNWAAFLSTMWFITAPMFQLGYQLNMYTQSVAAGERLLEILDTDNAVESLPNGRKDDVQGHVVFHNVDLMYGSSAALRGIDFEAQPGQTIAILGKTGSGKTSLVSLIGRYYDVTSGSVSVDGTDVREWNLDALRRRVAFVFQETFLFSSTIFANIAYGHPDASVEDVERAARMADAAEFIDSLPEGYHTIVGERGLGLSGGQKQRIALARAILSDPSILILDDATSAVDMETEYEIQQALEQVMKGRTTFIIAHRISSLKRADIILVMDEGRVVERGTHEELLRGGGLYREIFDMQFQDHDRFERPSESDDFQQAGEVSNFQ